MLFGVSVVFVDNFGVVFVIAFDLMTLWDKTFDLIACVDFHFCVNFARPICLCVQNKHLCCLLRIFLTLPPSFIPYVSGG